MLLSKLIKNLQDHYKEYGDLPVNLILESEGCQYEDVVGSTAVSVKYKENGKEVNIPQRVMIISENFD